MSNESVKTELVEPTATNVTSPRDSVVDKAFDAMILRAAKGLVAAKKGLEASARWLEARARFVGDLAAKLEPQARA